MEVEAEADANGGEPRLSPTGSQLLVDVRHPPICSPHLSSCRFGSHPRCPHARSSRLNRRRGSGARPRQPVSLRESARDRRTKPSSILLSLLFVFIEDSLGFSHRSVSSQGRFWSSDQPVDVLAVADTDRTAVPRYVRAGRLLCPPTDKTTQIGETRRDVAWGQPMWFSLSLSSISTNMPPPRAQ